MGRSKASVELFAELRREDEFGAGTIAGVARKFQVHRRLVREAVASAVPRERKRSERAKPRLEPLVGFMDEILEADRKAPRKQRHTAHRISTRIQTERPACPITEGSVRRYVRQRKLALGLLTREPDVPQSYDWGVEAQVDWDEAYAEFDGVRQKLQVFTPRSMASGAAFHRAYTHATQQAFLEAHEHAFHYFGGVFRRLRYDNLGAAVKRVLRGSRREETARFVAFRSHWRFESSFCTPSEGHEKGGVENEVGTFRRNHWVPLPQARDLADLHEPLLAACRADEARLLAGRTEPVGAALLIEREHLLPLAAEGFDLTEVSFPTVDRLGRVRVRTNAYSVPLRSGTQVQAKLTATTLEVWHDGRCRARHARCHGRQQEILDLEHSLDILEHKPGALAGSTPLEQWRRLGRWPASYDQFWQGLIERLGQSAGTREMIGLLQLGRAHGQDALRRAIETARELGCGDSAAVRHLLTAPDLAHAPVAPLAIGSLAQFERPLPAVSDYDQLLAGGVAR